MANPWDNDPIENAAPWEKDPLVGTKPAEAPYSAMDNAIEAVTDRTKDLGLSVGKGFLGLAKLVPDAARLALDWTGLTPRAVTAASDALESGQQKLQAMKSPQAQAEDAALQQAVTEGPEVVQDGYYDPMTGIKITDSPITSRSFKLDPEKLSVAGVANMGVESAPQMVGQYGFGKLIGGASKLAKLTPATQAVVGQAGSNAVMVAADTYDETYQEAKKKGLSDEQAQASAYQAAGMVAPVAAVTGGALGKLTHTPSGAPTSRIAKGLGMVRAGAGGAGEEFVEEGSQGVASSAALGEDPLSAKNINRALMGALAGGPFGVGAKAYEDIAAAAPKANDALDASTILDAEKPTNPTLALPAPVVRVDSQGVARMDGVTPPVMDEGQAAVVGRAQEQEADAVAPALPALGFEPSAPRVMPTPIAVGPDAKAVTDAQVVPNDLTMEPPAKVVGRAPVEVREAVRSELAALGFEPSAPRVSPTPISVGATGQARTDAQVTPNDMTVEPPARVVGRMPVETTQTMQQEVAALGVDQTPRVSPTPISVNTQGDAALDGDNRSRFNAEEQALDARARKMFPKNEAAREDWKVAERSRALGYEAMLRERAAASNARKKGRGVPVQVERTKPMRDVEATSELGVVRRTGDDGSTTYFFSHQPDVALTLKPSDKTNARAIVSIAQDAQPALLRAALADGPVEAGRNTVARGAVQQVGDASTDRFGVTRLIGRASDKAALHAETNRLAAKSANTLASRLFAGLPEMDMAARAIAADPQRAVTALRKKDPALVVPALQEIAGPAPAQEAAPSARQAAPDVLAPDLVTGEAATGITQAERSQAARESQSTATEMASYEADPAAVAREYGYQEDPDFAEYVADAAREAVQAGHLTTEEFFAATRAARENRREDAINFLSQADVRRSGQVTQENGELNDAADATNQPASSRSPGSRGAGTSGPGNRRAPYLRAEVRAPGAVTEVGIHYSGQPRQRLDGAYYGQGLKGAERDRLALSSDGRIKSRISLYIPKRDGTMPAREAGVGSKAHRLTMGNLYEPGVSPPLNTQIAPGASEQERANAFESAVLDAGYDGYSNRDQGQAVLLGKHSVEPEYLGNAPDVKDPLVAEAGKLPPAEPQPVKIGLMSREIRLIEERIAALEAAVPGAKLKSGSLVVDAQHEAAARDFVKSLGDANGQAVNRSPGSPASDPGRAATGGDAGGRSLGGADASGAVASTERAVAPLPGYQHGQVKGAAGPDPALVKVAEQYAADNGITLRRQAEYVQVDVERARRIADAYAAMAHAPQDPAVKEAYENLIRQTVAQYRALERAGYKFWFIDLANEANQDYVSTPWNAMRDIRANKQMGVFPTEDGFGSNADFDPSNNPLLADTGIQWPSGALDGPLKRVLANDLFRAVHDAFGHGLEGAGFRADGEENAWQAHVRLFTGSAVGAITSETRGQNSWLNFGPHGEANRTAKVDDTVFADQKTGLMPQWTWTDGVAGDIGADGSGQPDGGMKVSRAPAGRSGKVESATETTGAERGTNADLDILSAGLGGSKRVVLRPVEKLSDSQLALSNGAKKHLGVRVAFFSSTDPRAPGGGAFTGKNPNVLYINVADADPVWVMGHEFLHRLKNGHPDIYAVLLRVMRERSVDTLANRARTNESYGEIATDSMVEEENLADLSGFAFKDPAFWNALEEEMSVPQRRNFFQWAAQWFKELFGKLPKHDLDGDAGMRQAADDMRDIFAKAYAEAIKRERGVSSVKADLELGQAVPKAKAAAPTQRANSVTKTAEFKRWFGASEVVDENGEPLVMYHGTSQDFGEFKPGASGAIFVTKNPVVASVFSQMSGQKDGGAPSIMPVYVRAENAFDFQNREHVAKVADEIGRNGERPAWAKTAKEWAQWHAELLPLGEFSTIENPVVQAAIKQAGFDAFYVKEAGAKNLAVYDSAQLKSAIGNDGGFDPKNKDVRRSGDGTTKNGKIQPAGQTDPTAPSVPTTVSATSLEEIGSGRPAPITETPAFKRWFGKSVVVDRDGNPLRVYRGEHGATEDGDVQTLIGSYTFVADHKIASTYAQSPNDDRMEAAASRVVPAYLRIENPVINNRDDPFIEFSDIIEKFGLDEAKKLAVRYADRIEYTGNWMEDEEGLYDGLDSVEQLVEEKPELIETLYMDAYPLLDDKEFVALAMSKGYDGGIHVGNGESGAEDEYRVFSKSQIKSIFNNGDFDPKNPDMLRSGGSQRDITKTPAFTRWFSGSKAVDSKGDPLVVYHGTTKDFNVFDDGIGRNRNFLQKLKRLAGASTTDGDFFFAANDAFAGGYARTNGGNVMPVYLSIKNPATYEQGKSNGSLAQALESARKSGNDGVIVRNWSEARAPVSDVYIAFDAKQVKSATGNNGDFDPGNPDIRRSGGSRPVAGWDQPERNATQRAVDSTVMAASKAASPVTASMQAANKATDRIGQEMARLTGVTKLGTKVYDKSSAAITGPSRWAWVERAKHGLVSDYGIPAEYLSRKVDKQARENRQLRSAKHVLDRMSSLGPDQLAVAYQWLQEKPDTARERDLLAKLSPEQREVMNIVKLDVDNLSRQALEQGLISQETYERNAMAYIHRSYKKYELELTDGQILARQRAQRIKGDQFKGRGMELEASLDRVHGDLPEDLKGLKLEMLEKRSEDGKLIRRDYLVAGTPRPKNFQGYTSAGTWEVRDATRGGKLKVWRDFTLAERQSMGEIEDARYGFARTMLQGVRDVETARFLSWVGDNYAKDDDAGLNVVELKPLKQALGSQTFALDEWVKVPDTKIKGTQVNRYGALAGRYVPGVMWNDIIAMGDFQNTAWDKMLRLWKISKALALDTPIPTPGGWTTMGELKVGDEVFDENGVVCAVLDATDVQHDHQCYRVEFSDGSSIVADAGHLWMTVYHGKDGIRTTEEIKATLKERTRGDNNHSIPVAGALRLPDSDLPFAPYALGFWLGDGDTSGARLSIGGADLEEVVSAIDSCGERCTPPVKDSRSNVYSTRFIRRREACQRDHALELQRPGGGCLECDNITRRARNGATSDTSFTNPHAINILRDIGVIGRKHIPPGYLRASEDQRLALLQGLMDSDGHIANGMCGYVTTIPELRDDVVELLRSLGFKPSVKEAATSCNGKTGKMSYRISFKAYSSRPVFKLRRKLARLPKAPATRQRSQTRQIVAVEPVDSVPVRCILVSSESHLFLAGRAMVPTHNTALSPAVHVNNVMANFIMADLADVGVNDIRRALEVIVSSKRGNKDALALIERYQDSGAEGGSFAANEMKSEVIEPLLKQLAESEPEAVQRATLAQVVSLAAHGHIGEAAVAATKTLPGRMVGGAMEGMISAYQSEDSVFRLAKFINEVNAGKSDVDAGKEARDAFLDYSINAPWIRTAKRFAFPFLSFTYRVAPLLAKAALTKPWKFAKYMGLGYGLSVLAYGMLGDGGDEEKEKRLLPKDRQGLSVIGLPKLVRMPWNDKDSDPMWLDVRRWLPGGDITDMNEHSAVPIMKFMALGGTASLAMDLLSNTNSFTGQKIVQKTDSPGEVMETVTDYMMKWALPNLPMPGLGAALRTVGAPVNQGNLDPYAWASIEKAMKGARSITGKTEGVGQTVANTLGVKLDSRRLSEEVISVDFDYKAKEREIKTDLSKAANLGARGQISREEMQRRIKAEVEKLQELGKETAKKLAPAK